ncbi:hypothetical protein C5167_046907 [Papaver somniferum]|uniref:Uncharacterized protein n=1 Tax=Papaver somniferum TaxID=3469 RepID=A0A4Y7LHD0_PAPSO|nr:hypothetical protein C5167_046907 [Papaver somniferum]
MLRLLHFSSSQTRTLFPLRSSVPGIKRNYLVKCSNTEMVGEYLLSKERKQASLRLCNVSSFMTELLELSAENPSLHVVIIPGNPGVVQFYKHFVEGVYEMLDGRASVTGYFRCKTKLIIRWPSLIKRFRILKFLFSCVLI